MEVWLSILISGVLAFIGIIIGSYQIRRAVEAIHADIKHSQEKLELKIEKKK